MPGSTLPRTLRAALTSTVLCGALIASGGAAQARDHDRGRWPVPVPGQQDTLAEGLLSPLSLAVGHRDTVYVSQNFAGVIQAVGRGEPSTLVTADPGVELGSVSAVGRTLYYTTSVGAATPDFDAHLMVRGPRGDVEPLADLGRHERLNNPDGDVSYGLQADQGCIDQLPEGVPGSYTGGRDAHPYASTVWHGQVLVADAGSNGIVAVDRRGGVRDVAVLPPAPLTVTAEIAGAIGLPECAIGKEFRFESVPTDVEVGRDGWIYATSLPGGPEGDGPFPPLGAVYRVHPKNGTVELVARGFAGATNLAIGTKGEIYVTEMFAGRVSVIPRGSSTPQTFLEIPFPAAVEVDGRSLYVSTWNAFGGGADGQVVEVPLRTW